MVGLRCPKSLSVGGAGWKQADRGAVRGKEPGMRPEDMQCIQLTLENIFNENKLQRKERVVGRSIQVTIKHI